MILISTLGVAYSFSQRGGDLDSVFHRGGFGHGSDNFFKTLTRPLVMGGFMSATLRLSSVSAPSARRTRAARAHAAASTRSCPPREFQAVSGTARGPALVLGAEPRCHGGSAPRRPHQ